MRIVNAVEKAATWILAAAVMLTGGTQLTNAQALLSLKGTTDATRYEADGELRLSVLSFNDADATAAFVERYRQYATEQNHTAFGDFIKARETRGYIFSQEATGYTIKYAWQDPRAEGSRMVFVVTPALKTLNPYMWAEENNGIEPFTVVEVDFDGEDAVVKTSLDHEVEVVDGALRLRDFDGATTFATMQDNTPYYLSDS